MNLKVYKKQETEPKTEEICSPAKEVPYYENPTLIREEGLYYIGYEGERIQIEEWEAVEIYEHPERVYDVIISYRRKFYFNTAEDSVTSLFHFD